MVLNNLYYYQLGLILLIYLEFPPMILDGYLCQKLLFFFFSIQNLPHRFFYIETVWYGIFIRLFSIYD